MVLKKYLISATAMSVLAGSMASQGLAQNDIKEEAVIEKTVKQSGVSISVSDKTIKKGTKFNPKAGVTAKDYDGKDITQHVIVTYNNVNENQVGTYKVGYAVLGSNGKRVDVEITVKVIADSNQEIKTTITADDITIIKGSKFDPMKGVKAIDVTGKDITQYIVVNQNTVNTSVEGTYTVKYVVLDTKGNRVYKTRTVTVKENATSTKKETVINVEDKTIEKGSTFDPMKGVKAIDVTGKDITQYVLVVENTVNPNIVSVGTVKYLVLDTEGNRVYKTIKVTVTDGVNTAKTEIIANDITLNTGDVFEERKGVTAIDVTGKDITQYIVVTKNDVNTNKAGKYNVTYLVLDTEGNRVYKTITVTVEGEDVLTDEEKANIANAKKVSDMIEALDGRVITINDKDELRNIRKAYDALNKDAQALVKNLSILEDAEKQFDAIMDRIKNVIQLINALPGYDEVELSHEAQIQAVRDAFNALSVEEQNAIPYIQVSILESAELKIQLLKDNAVEVAIAEDLVQRITALESVVVDYSHETEIKAIREAYDKLTAPAQLLVVNYDEFVAIELELTHVYESIIYVDGLIERLPETIEYSHKDQVDEAKAEYDNLGTENQAGVKAENVTKLEEAVAEIERLEELKQDILQNNVEVQAVVAEIEQLPAVETITIDDKDQVMGAVARFRMLPEDVKFAVDVTPLEEAFDKVETLMAEEVVNLIDALPSIDDLDLTHATLLEEVRAKYNEISSRNNTKVTNINTLTELEVKMLELTNVNPVIIEIVNKIKDLDDVVTFDNFDDIDVKINEIEALMETVDRSDFHLITNFEKYDDVRYQLETLRRVYHVTTGTEVVELINQLPDDIQYVQWSHRGALEDIVNAYNKISDDEKLLVDNLDKLQTVGAEWRRIDNGINEIYSAIHRIPALENLTLADKHIVEEARRIYDSYDEKVQHYINNMNIGDLLNAEIKIEKLEKQ